MTGEEIRCKAIKRFIDGEPPKMIYEDLGRTKQWFFKSLKRYRSGDPHWYRSRSQAPRGRPTQISDVERQRIISIRNQLERHSFAQTGVLAIKWELHKAGVEIPSDRTINRLLKQEGLVKKTSYVPKGVEYSYFTEALCRNNIHQADLLGPRYIKGDGRFYSFNVMDVATHQVYLESQRSKEDRQTACSLMRCWKSMGMPDFLQIDNALTFRGSNRYPRSFGLVIRLCLHYGVTPVSIPINEPWRNGMIESFNDSYDKNFYRRQWFPSYSAIKRQSKNFQRFHNKHHRYGCLKGNTPVEVIAALNDASETLPSATKLPRLEHIPEGRIVLIRFIRSNRQLDIFTEKFKVPRDLVYSYVKAEIDTSLHTLELYLGDEFITSFDYPIPSGNDGSWIQR